MLIVLSIFLVTVTLITAGVVIFKTLSTNALKNNNQIFLDLAKAEFEKRDAVVDSSLKPIKESLEKFDTKIQEIEKSRVGAYAGLSQQVKSLLDSQLHLQKETSSLVRALRTPQVRGRWGEVQLKRVVELAGMLEHCDFYQQQSVTIEDGKLRPDLIIKLPGNKNIIVDAKAPLSSFLDSLDHHDENIQLQKLKDHARLIRDHMKKLSQKNYWEQFNPTPEFVVLFLPGETFFSAALEQDPTLIEQGANERVILATPTTLIALLKAISYGWKQESLAKNAQQISELGKELSKRLNDMHGHFSNVGDKLQKAVEAYNKTAASFETRVLVSARKFQGLNHTPEAELLNPIEISPRLVNEAEKIC